MHEVGLPQGPRLTVAAAAPLASFPAIPATHVAAAVAMPAAAADHVAASGVGDAPLAAAFPVVAAPLASADGAVDVAATGAGKVPCVAALSTGADGAGSGVAAAAAAAGAADPPRSRIRAFGEGLPDWRPAKLPTRSCPDPPSPAALPVPPAVEPDVATAVGVQEEHNFPGENGAHFVEVAADMVLAVPG